MLSVSHVCCIYSNALQDYFWSWKQTVWTLIRLFLKEQSDLGPYCLQDIYSKVYKQTCEQTTIVMNGREKSFFYKIPVIWSCQWKIRGARWSVPVNSAAFQAKLQGGHQWAGRAFLNIGEPGWSLSQYSSVSRASDMIIIPTLF